MTILQKIMVNIHYLFIEDFDGNEICLDFPLNYSQLLGMLKFI